MPTESQLSKLSVDQKSSTADAFSTYEIQKVNPVLNNNYRCSASMNSLKLQIQLCGCVGSIFA